MSTEMATRFFKSPEEIQKLLVQGILAKLAEKKLQASDLDGLCQFKAKGLVPFEQVTDNVTLMTPLHFSIASHHLRIAIDNILKVKLSKGDRKWVREHMERHGAKVVTASGASTTATAGNPTGVPPEEFAPVYVILQSLRAIDPKYRQSASAPRPI